MHALFQPDELSPLPSPFVLSFCAAQYMLLCKVLQGSASEVGAIMAGKWGVKHTGAELDAMSEVAKSAKNRLVLRI
ncbi:unnamed protein product [Scytosiphon promiscuus]